MVFHDFFILDSCITELNFPTYFTTVVVVDRGTGASTHLTDFGISV